MTTTVPALLFTLCAAATVLFQLALAAGMPWGRLTMGGRFPGKLPPAMRLMSLAQGLLLAAMATLVLARAGLLLPAWSSPARWMVWGVVAVSAVTLLLNLITPSAGERRLWAPVAGVMLLCSILVALG